MTKAAREGYTIRKSRRYDSIDNFGEYMLVEVSLNCPVLGYRYHATLLDIAEFLEAPQAEYFGEVTRRHSLLWSVGGHF